MKQFDIIRFYTNGNKRLIKANCTEEEKNIWCNSPKTQKIGKWFDGFTSQNLYKCQQGRAAYPNNFTPDDLPKYN